MAQIPEALRGKYNRFGWTANGVQPWGLQPDPIGADGYLFFRAWFLLLLATHKYISGDDKWARPFKVTGYHDETFDWDMHRIAERLESQYRAHPEGPQCENTKIWIFCNTAGGLGMHLYDKVFGKNTHRAFENFIGYTRENYMKVGSDGKLQSITSYYDPVEKFHFGASAAGGLSTAHLMLPQNPELGRLLYEGAANALGWRAATGDVRANSTGLVMAKELGDDVAYERLRAAAEREYEPKVFGEHQEQFGWFFNNKEGFPRGQGSAMLMAAEVAGPGDWTRAFEARYQDKYTRADGRRRRVPVSRCLAGVERPRHRHLACGDVCGGTRQARRGDAMAGDEPAQHRRTLRCGSTVSRSRALRRSDRERLSSRPPSTRTSSRSSPVTAATARVADVEPAAKPRTAAAAASLVATTANGGPAANPPAMNPGCPCCGPA